MFVSMTLMMELLIGGSAPASGGPAYEYWVTFHQHARR